jgi:hypothetical protein
MRKLVTALLILIFIVNKICWGQDYILKINNMSFGGRITFYGENGSAMVDDRIPIFVLENLIHGDIAHPGITDKDLLTIEYPIKVYNIPKELTIVGGYYYDDPEIYGDIGFLTCALNYTYIGEKTYSFTGANSKNIMLPSPSSSFCCARVNAEFELIQPSAPQINITSTQNNHITAVTTTSNEGETTTSYTVCDCDCQTIFQTGYVDEGMEYVWNIYLGAGTNKTLLYTSAKSSNPTLSENLSSIRGLDTLTIPHDIIVTVTPSNTRFPSWTFQTSKELVVTIRPQSKFIQLNSGRNADVYPIFTSDTKAFSLWGLVYNPANKTHINQALQVNIPISASATNGGDTTTFGDKKLYKFGLNRTAGVQNQSIWSFKFQNVEGNASFSEKSCYAETSVSIPQADPSLVFKVSKTNDGNDCCNGTDGTIYLCSGQDKLYITANRGRKVEVKKEGGGTIVYDYTYSSLSDISETKTVEFTPDEFDKKYTIIYTDIAGTPVTRNFTIKGQPATPELTLTTIQPQLCKSVPDGKITYNISDGYSITNYSFNGIEKRITNGGNQISENSLATGIYNITSINAVHIASGCPFLISDKEEKIGEVTPTITGDPDLSTFYLSCGNAMQSVNIATSNDTRIKLVEEFNGQGTSIGAGGQRSLGVGTYNYKISYNGQCSDNQPSKAISVQPPSINIEKESVVYNQTGEPYAYIIIPYSKPLPFDDKWIVTYRENKNGAVSVSQNLNSLTSEGKIRIPVAARAENDYADYIVSVTRKDCSDKFLLDEKSIPIKGRLSFLPSNSIKDGIENCSYKITTTANSGSGGYEYFRKRLGASMYDKYNPGTDPFGVGSYSVYAKDSITQLTTEPVTIVVGVENPLSVSIDNIAIGCFGYDAKLTARKQGGGSDVKYKIPNLDTPYTLPSDGVFSLPKQVYANFKSDSKISFTDNYGCTVDVDKLSFSEPDELKITIDDSNSTFFTKCETSAKVAVTVTTKSPIYPLKYCYAVGSGVLSSVTCFESNELFINQTGEVRVYVTDANGCKSKEETRPIESKNVKLIVDNTTITRVTERGKIDASIVLSADNGSTPFSFACVRQGEAVKDSDIKKDVNTFTVGAGSYDVYVVDAARCTDKKSITILNPFDGLSLTATADNNPQCHGSSSGSISVTVDSDPTMKLKRVLAFNLNTNRKDSVNFNNNTPIYNFYGLPPGSYSVFVRNEANTTSAPAVVTLTENKDVTITPRSIEPLFGSIQDPKEKTEVVFDLAKNGNNINEVSYKDLMGGWHTLIESSTDEGRYRFEVEKGGIYPINVRKCGSIDTPFDKEIDVLQIPLPSFDKEIRHPKNNDTGGSLTLKHDISNSDPRYQYRAVVKSTDGNSFNRTYEFDSHIEEYTINGLGQGTYSLEVYSLYNNIQKGKMETYTFTINKKLLVSLSIPNLQVKICSGSKADTSKLSGFLKSIVNVDGGYGVKTFKFISAISNTEYTMADEIQLPADKYYVAVTDENGTTAKTTDLFEVEEMQPVALNLSVVGGTVLPCYEKLATVNVVPSGGWGNYGTLNVVSVVDNNTTTSAAELIKGNYSLSLGRGTHTLSVTDGLGCTSKEYPQTLTAPAMLTLEIDDSQSKTDLKCKSTNDGKVALKADGGNGGYSYSYTLGASSVVLGGNTADKLAVGSYSFTVTDSKGCMATVSRAISTDYIPQNSDFTIDSTRVRCYGESNGTIKLSNASDNFTYKLSRNDTDEELPFQNGTNNSLSKGAYKVTWINKTNPECSYDDTVNIGQPDALEIVDLHVVPSCKGDLKGKISFKAAGGTAPWSASLNTDAFKTLSNDGKALFENLKAAPSYTINLKDSKGCATSVGKEVFDLTELSNLDVIIQHSCEGSSAASITLTPKDSSRTQEWKFYQKIGGIFLEYGQLSAYQKLQVRELAPATYKATLTDTETGCTLVNREDAIHPKVEIVSVTPSKVKCKGGKALIAVNIGQTSDPVNYYYIAKNSSTEVEFTPTTDALAAGEYTLVVRSAFCEASASFTVLEPNDALDVTLAPATIKTLMGVDYHVSCSNGSNGKLSVTPSGGWQGYSLLVDGKAINLTPEISQLAGGTHAIRITDQEGCFVEKSITLNAPSAPLVLNEVKKWQEKSGSSIADTVILKPTGGFGGYRLNLDALNIAKSAQKDGDEVKFTFTGAGIFRFTATDTLGCQVATDVTLDQLSQLKYAKQVSAPTCYGGNDGSISITNGLDSYSYTLKGEGYNVSQKGNCAFDGLKSGKYTLKVTDGTFTEYSPAEIATPLQIAISAMGDSTCQFVNNGMAQIMLTNGVALNRYSITLTDESNTAQTTEIQGDAVAKFVGLTKGSYKLVAVNLNSSCAESDNASASVEIGRLRALAPTISSVHFCGDENGKVVGNFNVGLHNFNAELLNKNKTTGSWESISSTTVGGSINNLAPEVSPGWYRFRTTDTKYGCQEYTDSIIVYPSPQISKVEVDNEICFGQKGTLRVFAENGSGKLSIFQGQDEYERIFNNTVNLAPGSYKLLVYDDLSGCSLSYPTPAVINGPSQKFAFSLTPSLYGSYNIDCNGNASGSIAVNLTGGGTLQSAAYGDMKFTTRDFSIPKLSAGWHSFTATDSFGCNIKDSVELKQPLPLNLALAESNLHLGCSNANAGMVKLVANGGSVVYQYSMNQQPFAGISTFENLAVGNYNFKVKDSNGCISELNTAVDTKFTPFSLHLEPQNITCFGANDGKIAAIVDGSSTFTYKWHTDGSTDSQIAKLSPGTYGVTATTTNGCSKDLFAQITQPEKLSFSFTTKSACPGEVNGIVNFDAIGGTKPYTFLLNDQPYGSVGKNISAAYGLYVAKVVDANGCTEMQSLNIGKKEGSITANFLVATTSATSDTLVLVDVCNPMPDRIVWDLSNDGQPIRRVNTNEENSPLIKFDGEGDYRITMTAYYGECEYTVSKIISVKNGIVSDGSKAFVLGANGIKQFEVFPNPTKGQSKFRIALYQPYEAVLQIFNLKGQLVSVQEIPAGTSNEGAIEFNSTTPTAYIVRVSLKNKKDYREVKVIVQ